GAVGEVFLRSTQSAGGHRWTRTVDRPRAGRDSHRDVVAEIDAQKNSFDGVIARRLPGQYAQPKIDLCLRNDARGRRHEDSGALGLSRPIVSSSPKLRPRRAKYTAPIIVIGMNDTIWNVMAQLTAAPAP